MQMPVAIGLQRLLAERELSLPVWFNGSLALAVLLMP